MPQLHPVKTSQKRRKQISSWGVPLIYASATLIVGTLGPRLEHDWLPQLVSNISAPAAMAICSAVSSGMIALTGIVFSLAFVMVQFSATAYSPRLVLWVAQDPVISHALGLFTSTFLYSLLFMIWIDREAAGTVPLLGSWLVLALLLGSMGMFIALIHRIGLLQVNRMLIFTGDRGRRAIGEMYSAIGHASPEPVPAADSGQRPVTQTVTHVGRPQVIQTIGVQELRQYAIETDALIEVVAAVGDTVLEVSPLVRVRGSRIPLDEVRLRRALVIGDERTFEQDPKYALRIVVDIAIKALSPAINDPTTAVQALDQIEDLLIRLGRCSLDIGEYRDERGGLRLSVSFPTWDDFLLLALDEIRSCGAQSVQVMRRMNALIRNLREVLPPERGPALDSWKKRLGRSVARNFEDAEEKQDASVADRQGLGIGEETPER